MDIESRNDLVGFALAIAVQALQQTDEIRERHADDIEGMLELIETHCDPDTAAAHFWCAPGETAYSTAPKPGSDNVRIAYWNRTDDAFNALTADLMFGPEPVKDDNVVDFSAFKRRLHQKYELHRRA